LTSVYARNTAGNIELVSDVNWINRLSFVSTYILLFCFLDRALICAFRWSVLPSITFYCRL